MAKHNKVCFYPFKPLKRIAETQEGFSRATREGREEYFASYFHYSRETVSDHEKKIIAQLVKVRQLGLFRHVHKRCRFLLTFRGGIQ